MPRVLRMALQSRVGRVPQEPCGDSSPAPWSWALGWCLLLPSIGLSCLSSWENLAELLMPSLDNRMAK